MILRRALALLALSITPVLLLGATAGAQGSSEQIDRYEVSIVIEHDGRLHIQETIRYDFGSTPHHGIYRDVPVRFDYPKKSDTDRVYPIENISVRASEGTPADYTTEDVSSNGVGYERIKIGDPDTTITGAHTYEIAYDVRGALNSFRDHDELYWNAIGTEWATFINQAVVTVEAPADITQVACFQGSFGSSLPCTSASTSGTTASFSQSNLFPYNGLTVVVAIPKGAVSPPPKPILEERWTPGRAFEVTPLTGGVAGGLLLVGIVGYVLVFSRKARDRRYKGGAVDQTFGSAGGAEEVTPLRAGHTETPVEFVPPDDLRPGQVGTLVDFVANPLDVTATIIDLAVRKYLVIDEVDTDSRWLRNDWKLTKLDPPTGKAAGELKPYEQELLDGLFRDGNEVQLSDLKQHFATRMSSVQKALMDDAMAQGWFTRRPDSARVSTGCLGVLLFLVGLGVTIGLAVFTHLALLGVPLVIFGIVVMVSARWAPARTAKGSGILRRANGFRRFIEESEKDRAQFAEKKNLFSEYLPYAVVFGATDKWARTFAGLDGEPPDTSSWYRSSTPFEYLAFSSAINGFTVTTSGTLTSTPPSTSGSSGFSSGGGFSGGGGGGGGGGSW